MKEKLCRLIGRQMLFNELHKRTMSIDIEIVYVGSLSGQYKHRINAKCYDIKNAYIDGVELVDYEQAMQFLEEMHIRAITRTITEETLAL